LPFVIASAGRRQKSPAFQGLEQSPEFLAMPARSMHTFLREFLHLIPRRQTMARIVIKDLLESVELDRKAMVAIVGGARGSGSRVQPGGTIFRTNRIVSYPAGFHGRARPETGKPE
jgi:hypothetical protein